MTAVVINTGTTTEPNDTQLNNQTIELGSTAGAAATLVFSGDSGITFSSPTLNQTSVIDSAVPGQTTPEQSVLLALGTFINQGSILANGPAGSTFTLQVSQAATGTAAGYFINDQLIAATVGNTLDISIGTNAEFFNPGEVLANGGYINISAAPGAIVGGLAPVAGVFAMQNGGTIEDNTALTPGADGSSPY
ncbi:MAG: hypothetical protein ACREF3_11155, partial [Acetobacteraceae bacterium]